MDAPTTARRRRARRRGTAAAAAPGRAARSASPAPKSMNRRLSWAWMKRSCGPAAIPRSSVSIASASRASAPARAGWRTGRTAPAGSRSRSRSTRRARPRAGSPFRRSPARAPTPVDPVEAGDRGLDQRPGAGGLSPRARPRRASPGRPSPAIANPIVLPPKPSEGLPSSAARARASPRATRADPDLGSLVTACEDGTMSEPEQTPQCAEAEVEATGPGELGRSPGEVTAAASGERPDPRQPAARGAARRHQRRRRGTRLVAHGPGAVGAAGDVGPLLGPRPDRAQHRAAPAAAAGQGRARSRRWSPTTRCATATPRSWSRPARCCTTSACRSTAPTTRPTASSSPSASCASCSPTSTATRPSARS